MIVTPRDAEYWSIATLIPELATWAVPFRDAYLAEIDLRDYQLDLIRRVVAAMRAGYRRILVVLPTGGGKCLGRGTSVMMFDGSIKAVEDVEVGDLLMGPDSTPRRVLSTCTGREELYRVVPKKGDPYVVNKSHILSLRLTGGVAKTPNPGKLGGNYPAKIVNISVEEYLATSKTFKHIAKGWRTGVDFTGGAVPLDSYFLGLWLGDGGSRHPSITTADAAIVDYLGLLAVQYGLTVRREISGGRCPTYFLTTEQRGRANPVLQHLQLLNLIENKHVPAIYKTASRDDRLRLLAGLIDSDGHLSKNGHYDFVFKSKTLAEDVIFIARSLGFAAYLKPSRKTCTNNGVSGDYWRFSLTGDVDQIPVKLAHKRSGPRRQKKDVTNVGIEVEPIGEGDYFGFEIDGDRLFLLGDFTVTHNTVMAAAMLNSASALGFPSQFVVHRKELIEQTSRTFTGMAIDHSFVASGKPFDPEADVLLAGVQTLANRLDLLLPPNTVIIDEAHHATAATWARVMEAYGDSYIVGLTATPQRLDGQGLDDHFDIMIEGPTTAELIEWGYLSPFDYYAPSAPDLTGVGTVMGDYARGELAAAVDKPKLIGDIVEHYLKLARGSQGILFAASREHSRHLALAFCDAGVRAAHVDGAMPDKERARIDAAFRAGDLTILTNCELFGEGYDVPAVVYCGLARPTKSLALHRQQSGRALRLFEGKTHAVICDHAGNVNRHGLPDRDVTWTLEGRPKSSRATGCNDDAMPIRQCLECFRVVPSVVAVCPGCDTPFPKQVRELKQEAGELKKIAKAEHVAEMARRKSELRECKSLADFEAHARKYGYKNPEAWASMQKSMRSDYARFRRR